MAANVLSIAAWEQYPWLRAGFSARHGGASTTYGGDGELNLGWTKEDAPKAVAENRRRFLAAVTGGPAGWELVTMRQVHGNAVQVVHLDQAPLATTDGKAMFECDGLITAEPGLLLGAQTADCVPVLLADTRLRAVAALHAGWRGTVARMAEHGVAAMQREFGSKPEDIVAAIGPAIRSCCFAVGQEVRERFAKEFIYADDLFVEDEGQFYADLHTANQRQLVGAGVRAEAIVTVAECTSCARDAEGRRRYFSHRADRGVTGRMMSVIGVAGTVL